MGRICFHQGRHVKGRQVGYLQELVYTLGGVTPWVHQIPEMTNTENKKI